MGSKGSKGSSEYRARQRDRERRRRKQQERSTARQPSPMQHAPAEVSSSGAARRTAATTCGWCRGAITPRSRGPIPKWCSATCRHRAWEQSRAAASGRSAVTIVERVVTVPAGPPASAPKPRQLAWVDVLRELVTQIEEGAVHDRHLLAVAAALDDASAPCTGATRLDAHPRGGGVTHRDRGGDTGVTWSGTTFVAATPLSPRSGCQRSPQMGAFWRRGTSVRPWSHLRETP